MKVVTIGEGEEYSFEYVGGSMKYDEATNYFVITLHDVAKKLTVDYKVTVEHNDEKSETNFIVESSNERKD